jgi:transposase
VVSREQARQFDPEAAVTFESAGGDAIQVQRVGDEDGKEVRLYGYSEARAEKENAMTQRQVERFEAGLNQIAEGLSKPRGEKNLQKLQERIGRLKERSRGIGAQYEITLTPDPSGRKAIALQFEKRFKDGSRYTHPSVYVLRSNETTWDAERLWRTYTQLTDLEAVFRSLKSELGLRPVFHHQENRVDGHWFITVLAYQFVQIIRRTLREKGITGSWNSLREVLGSQCRITASFQRTDGRALHVRKATRPEAEAF